MCGGTFRPTVRGKKKYGLSPRVRGNLPDLLDRSARRRSIPACAGEPLCYYPRPRFNEVYPRVCGGTLKYEIHGGAARGLSPRVRGNQAFAPLAPDSERSIPACAGEPLAPGSSFPPERVYPRVCGGTGVLPQKLAEGMGLSPRVRGNHARTVTVFPILRSIPACAGEPHTRETHDDHKKVYPRVCGGTVMQLEKRFGVSGLSPRVRGNRGHRLLGCVR